MKTKTAMQEAIDKIEELVSIRNFQKWEQLKKEFLEKERKQLESYASQPMSEPTVQQLREASKNNPDTFLAGALYVIDNYKLNSPSMSAEQYSSGAIHSIGEFPAPAMSAEQVEGFNPEKQANIISIANEMFSTAPAVKAEGWVSGFGKKRLKNKR